MRPIGLWHLWRVPDAVSTCLSSIPVWSQVQKRLFPNGDNTLEGRGALAPVCMRLA